MPLVPANNPNEVRLSLSQCQQLYNILAYVQQEAQKKVGIAKHSAETALFLADAIKDGISHPNVTVDMLKQMSKDWNGLHTSLEGIQKRMDEGKKILRPESH